MYFDFKNNQPFLKNSARKVKFRQFTWIKVGNERFAVKKMCDYFFIFRPHNWWWKIIIYDAFFTNSAKTPLYLHSME